jgi:ankyrin repeat protein
MQVERATKDDEYQSTLCEKLDQLLITVSKLSQPLQSESTSRATFNEGDGGVGVDIQRGCKDIAGIGKSFASNASFIGNEGSHSSSRSRLGNGEPSTSSNNSMLGEPLTLDQYHWIKAWIPPPAPSEKELIPDIVAGYTETPSNFGDGQPADSLPKRPKRVDQNGSAEISTENEFVPTSVEESHVGTSTEARSAGITVERASALGITKESFVAPSAEDGTIQEAPEEDAIGQLNQVQSSPTPEPSYPFKSGNLESSYESTEGLARTDHHSGNPIRSLRLKRLLKSSSDIDFRCSNGFSEVASFKFVQFLEEHYEILHWQAKACLDTTRTEFGKLSFRRCFESTCEKRLASTIPGHFSPLHYLACAVPRHNPHLCCLNEVLYLLSNGAKSDVRAEKYTALDLAAASGHSRIVKLFLENGASVNSAADDGTTALHLATNGGHLNVVKVLISHGSNVDPQTSDGVTPLHLAAVRGHDDILEHLLYHRADPNAKAEATALFRTDDGVAFESLPRKKVLRRRALEFALKNGRIRAVRLLISYGSKTATEVLNASKGGHEKVLQLLLSNGADANVTDTLKRTALLLSISGRGYQLAQMLLTHGADANIADNIGHTPLHEAVMKGNSGFVQLLFVYSANVNAPDHSGRTALHEACWRGHKDIIQILLANRSININALDKHGCTALHYAAHHGPDEVVRLLLSKGANRNIKTGSGATAESLAVQRRKGERNKSAV